MKFSFLLYTNGVGGGPSMEPRVGPAMQQPIAPTAIKEKVRNCAVILFRDPSGHVLLQKRQNTSMMNHQFALIGGGIEKNETAEAAAIREAKEELGVELKPQELNRVHHMPIHFTNNRVLLDSVFFEVTNFQGLPRIMEPQNASALGWFLPTELPRESAPYVPFLLEKLKNGDKESEFTTEL